MKYHGEKTHGVQPQVFSYNPNFFKHLKNESKTKYTDLALSSLLFPFPFQSQLFQWYKTREGKTKGRNRKLEVVQKLKLAF